MAGLRPTGIDTPVVGGGADVYAARHDSRLTGWVAVAAGGTRRATSVSAPLTGTRKTCDA